MKVRSVVNKIKYIVVNTNTITDFSDDRDKLEKCTLGDELNREHNF